MEALRFSLCYGPWCVLDHGSPTTGKVRDGAPCFMHTRIFFLSQIQCGTCGCCHRTVDNLQSLGSTSGAPPLPGPWYRYRRTITRPCRICQPYRYLLVTELYRVCAKACQLTNRTQTACTFALGGFISLIYLPAGPGDMQACDQTAQCRVQVPVPGTRVV